MKTFTKMAAQGDFIIMRIDSIPSDAKPIPAVNGKHVIAHSETGHNHVMEATRVTAYTTDEKTSTEDLYNMFLNVEEPTVIEHLRSFDTHEPILVPAGNYKIFRQREYTPEGFRKAAD